MNLSFGISTCPNDTFIFGALFNNFINKGFNFQVVLDDVELLNRLALLKKLDIVKVSYGVVPLIKENYSILRSGGALSKGFGPVLISKSFQTIDGLKGRRIGIPGLHTTAYNLFTFFFGENFDFIEMRFDRLINALLDDEVDASLLIHEGRFVYKKYGFSLIADLGKVWEDRYNAPIPLGCIVIKNEFKDIAFEVNDLIRSSIKFAYNNYDKLYSFIKMYAQELDDEIIKKHIEAFVNEYTYDNHELHDLLADFLKVDKNIFV